MAEHGEREREREREGLGGSTLHSSGKYKKEYEESLGDRSSSEGGGGYLQITTYMSEGFGCYTPLGEDG